MKRSTEQSEGDKLVKPDLDRISQNGLQWIKRQLAKGLQISHNNDETTPKEISSDIIYAGSVSLLVDTFYANLEEMKDADLNRLKVEITGNGTTNVAIRVWDPVIHSSPPEELRSGNNGRSCSQPCVSTCETNGTYAVDDGIKKKCVRGRHGIFVKIGFRYPLWIPSLECPLSRLTHEYFALEKLGTVCPKMVPLPLICGTDKFAPEDIMYIAMEFFPGEYDQYLRQFQEGSVDIRPAKILGFIFAKLHTMPLSSAEVLDEILLEKTINGYKRVADLDKHITNPEIRRCIQRHMENMVNPPPETAAFIHYDAHLLNVVVRADVECDNLMPLDDVEFTKLLDMEFSNWGPAGADLGIFMGSVIFYSLVHVCKDTIDTSYSILAVIPILWDSYVRTYFECARCQCRDDNSIQKSLFYIAHEAVGWAGMWMLRMSRLEPFYNFVTTKALFQLSPDKENFFRSHISPSTGDNGFEVLRKIKRKLSEKIAIMRFGDSVDQMLARNEINITIEAYNGVINEMIKLVVEELKDMKIVINELQLSDDAN